MKAGVGQVSRNSLGFGCAFFDVDLDGRLDLVAVNGHIDETVRNIRRNVGLRAAAAPVSQSGQRAGFSDVAAARAPTSPRRRSARGVACGDFDRDGDVDLLMTTNRRPRVPLSQRRCRTATSPSAFG